MRGRVLSIGRQVAAVLAGYATMLVVARTVTAILRQLLQVARDPNPPVWYVIIDLTYSLGAVAAGGAVCAYVGRRWTSPLVLATILLILGVMTAFLGLDKVHAAWYTWASGVLGSIAAMVGAGVVLKARTRGQD